MNRKLYWGFYNYYMFFKDYKKRQTDALIQVQFYIK